MIARPFYLNHAGERWRVYDCDYADRRFRPVPLESKRARYRVFVSESGWRKARLFQKGESRALDAAAEQIARAGYITPFPASYQPPDWRDEANRRDAGARWSRWVGRAMAKAAETLASAA